MIIKANLLHVSLSGSMHGVTGQFCGQYFTVWPAKFGKSFLSVCPINLRDITNILLTLFSQSVL